MDPEIFDISSDDEESSSNELPTGDNFDWISELLGEVDKENDDSDDVVIVGEVNPNKQRLKSLSIEKSSSKDVDDDDCVVLDGDPDNPVSVSDVNDKANDESDELLIVGEKGQIACKDFAHSRHDCANFPFSSTPHERHCELCHCYVCDSPAPCAHWGTGISSAGHCHATDKEVKWKVERKNFQRGRTAPLPVSKFSDTSLPTALPQLNHIQQFTQLDVNAMSQNLVSRPTTIRACSTSTNFGIPNIISQRSGFVGKNRFQSHLVSQQLPGLRGNAVRRDRVHNVGTLGPQFLSSRTMFKRPGSVGGPYAINRSGYGSSNNINCAYTSQYSRNLPPPMTLIDKNPAWRQDSCPTMNLESDTFHRSQPNEGSIFANTVPSQAPVYSPPILQPNDSQNIYQDGNQTQNAADSSFLDFGWVDNTNQSNQQAQVENTQLQSAEPTKEPSLVTEFNSQFPGSANPSSLYFDFEDWLMENQPVPGVSGAPVPPESNILSSEPQPIDAGMLLFDFETSLNGLMNWT